MGIIKKYDQSLMRQLNAFEQITKVRAKDCFSTNGTLFFFVEKGVARIAIGRQGAGVRALANALDKQVRILEWLGTPEGLVKSYLFPLRTQDVVLTAEGILEIQFKFALQRRNLLSDRQARLRELTTLIQHFYPKVRDIKVL
tara:strand:- start:417 stop:842 length:426 start_codon:yes stop_codon:yes gene_type:complete